MLNVAHLASRSHVAGPLPELARAPRDRLLEDTVCLHERALRVFVGCVGSPAYPLLAYAQHRDDFELCVRHSEGQKTATSLSPNQNLEGQRAPIMFLPCFNLLTPPQNLSIPNQA